MTYQFSKLVISVFLVFTGLSSVAATDSRLVGNWQGQRNQEEKCSFMAWKISRTADGKFEIIFFKDPERQQVLGSEKGRWESEGGNLSLITDGVPTPDIYAYSFIDENSVKLTNVRRDQSADCMADYEFVDHRFSQ